jgi:peptide chain release factor subunit 1
LQCQSLIAVITQEQIQQLLAARDNRHLITSFYFNTDVTRRPVAEQKIRLKDMLQAARRDLEGREATHAQRESLLGDFGAIEQHFVAHAVSNSHKGIAIFSCSARKFWQTYALPRGVRNILIADFDPYIRPLSMILDEYHRFCTVVVDRARAQIYEIYMGEILDRSEAFTELPRFSSRSMGQGGREERRFERHHEDAVRRHFHRVARFTFDIFQAYKFDYLVVGTHHELFYEFERHLHPYLRARLVGNFTAEPGVTAPAEVLAQTMAIETKVEREDEVRTVNELLAKVDRQDAAVLGLHGTLTALQRGAVQTLVVEDGYEVPGFMCYNCHVASVDDGACPHCGGEMTVCPDVVDEAIEVALQQGAKIEHIRTPTPLRERGFIGALLRFKS